MRTYYQPISAILLASAAMSAIPSVASAQDTQNPERQSRMVENYSKSFNVPADEARRRLKAQRDVGELNAKLEQEQRDTFGGLYIEHSPTFRVVVKFTTAGSATLARYTQDPAFVAEPAIVSFQKLVDTQASVYKLLKGLGVESASTVDVRTGRIKFVVENPAVVEQLKTAGTLSLPDFIDIGKATNLNPQREAKIEGGRGLKNGSTANNLHQRLHRI
ncbi:hypothetical protein [Sphingobium sp. Z007]|nr:hypothetical protein [Sphingobium sp. Z007]